MRLVRPACIAALASIVLVPPVVAWSRPITTLAGGGDKAPQGGSETAGRSARLGHPTGMDRYPASAGGGFVYADTETNQILRVSPRGEIRVLVGNGALNPTKSGPAAWEPRFEGMPGLSVPLQTPHDVATLPDGSLLIADTAASRILRWDRTRDAVTTVAGDGLQCYGPGNLLPRCGTELPAMNARISWPASVSAAPDGAFVVTTGPGSTNAFVGTDGKLHAMLEAGPSDVLLVRDGVVRRLMGTGWRGYTVVDGRASGLRTQLESPSDAAIGPDGRLYVADAGNCRILSTALDRAGSVGPVRLVAGRGPANCLHAPRAGAGHAEVRQDERRFYGPLRGDVGDGRLATRARFKNLGYVSFSGRGHHAVLYVADFENCRIRRLSLTRAARVTTVAGNGRCAAVGDLPSRTPATGTALFWPNQALPVDAGRARGLVVADTVNRRLRLIRR
jgi:hypothetical protein